MNTLLFKKLGVLLIIWIVYTFILFAGIMFTKAEINPFEWEERSRGILTYLSLLPFCLGLLATILHHAAFEKEI